MSKPLGNLLKDTKQLLILLPINPNFDEVAAGLGLYLSLNNKPEATIACPTPMLVEFNRLVGVNKVTTELGNKNLTMKLIDYPAEQVERVSYDIERGEFKLTVISKPGFTAPKQDQVAISHSGVSADTIILIGGMHDDHFPALTSKDVAGAKVVHLATKSGKFSKEVISLAQSVSSISELVGSLIKENELQLDGDIATNLLMGIDEGSKGFSAPDINADTFALAADLMRAGGKRMTRAELPDARHFPPGSIPGMKPTPKSWYEPKVFKGSGVPTS